ncbi:hypothetical protein [Sulfurospirillum sp. UCH001]|uniref:hypothetical protein n=1 Tax=Sulfurospirillum sp. UCH001 TaxID=1581011 RepID=UPI000836AB2F|nr:hypothetical protein [Sulfurospirillum sp. UCH001]
MKSLLLIIPLLFLTGCGVAGKYNPDYVSQSIEKNYKKVDSVSVGIIKNDEILPRESDNVALGKITLNLETGDINSNISKEFFSQYFSNVKLINPSEKADIIIKSKIDNYSYLFNKPSDGSTITLNYSIEVYKKDKLILKKTYTIKESNDVLITLVGVSSPLNGLKELIHKSLLGILENQVKPDILNSL